MCVSDAGIEVEVVTPAPQAAPRIPASQDLGALALFHSYAATVGMSQPALPAALELLRVGSLLPVCHDAAVAGMTDTAWMVHSPVNINC